MDDARRYVSVAALQTLLALFHVHKDLNSFAKFTVNRLEDQMLEASNNQYRYNEASQLQHSCSN